MIRTATFDDLPAVVDLARLYHDEAHTELPFDLDYVRDALRIRTIDTMDGICLLLIGADGIAGFLAGAVTMHFSAPIKIAVELAWYVRPDQRGRSTGMLDEFEGWARWKGCSMCSLALNEFPGDAARTKALIRIYDRRGYRPFERAFLKKIA